MCSATGVILTLGVLVGLAYMARADLPYSPVFTFSWKAQEFYIPFNIAVFWACAATGVLASAFQMIRAMMRDVDRLR